MTPATDRLDPRSARARHMAHVESLDALIGAHPDALRDHYFTGTATDPTELSRIGDVPGRLLALEPLSPAFVLTRSLVRALGNHSVLWRGKTFESGGTAGADQVLGGVRVRFRCEVDASRLDEETALVFHYDDLGNGWPWSRTYWELRDIAKGIAIGPIFFETATGPRLFFWYGLRTR